MFGRMNHILSSWMEMYSHLEWLDSVGAIRSTHTPNYSVKHQINGLVTLATNNHEFHGFNQFSICKKHVPHCYFDGQFCWDDIHVFRLEAASRNHLCETPTPVGSLTCHFKFIFFFVEVEWIMKTTTTTMNCYFQPDFFLHFIWEIVNPKKDLLTFFLHSFSNPTRNIEWSICLRCDYVCFGKKYKECKQCAKLIFNWSCQSWTWKCQNTARMEQLLIFGYISLFL